MSNGGVCRTAPATPGLIEGLPVTCRVFLTTSNFLGMTIPVKKLESSHTMSDDS